MMSKNPQQAIQSLMNNNPQIAQAWQIAQNIQKSGGSKVEMLKKACQQSGMDYQTVKNNLSSFGIKM